MQWWWEYNGWDGYRLVTDWAWDPGLEAGGRILDDSFRYIIVPFSNAMHPQAVQVAEWDGNPIPPPPTGTTIPAEPGKLLTSSYTLTDTAGGAANTFDRDWLIRYHYAYVAWGEVRHGVCPDSKIWSIGEAVASPLFFDVPNIMDSPNVDDETPPLNFGEKDWSAISLAILIRVSGALFVWTSETRPGRWCDGQTRYTDGTVDVALEYLDGSAVLDKDGVAVAMRDPLRELSAQLGYKLEGQAWKPMRVRVTTENVNNIRVDINLLAYVQGKPADGIIPPDPVVTPIPNVQFPTGSVVNAALGRGSAVDH